MTFHLSIFPALSGLETGPLGAALSFGMTAYNKFQNDKENEFVRAQEASKEFESKENRLDNQKEYIKNSKTALSDENLSNENRKIITDSLNTIQGQIVQEYGEQAKGLDLTGGDLQSQLDILDQLSKINANDFLNKSQMGKREADSVMEKSTNIPLGNDVSKYADNTYPLIQEIAQKYPTISLVDSFSTEGAYNVNFDGTTATAINDIPSFMNEVRSLQANYSKDSSGFNELEKILDISSLSLPDLETIQSDFGFLYDQINISKDILQPDSKNELTPAEYEKPENISQDLGFGIENFSKAFDSIQNLASNYDEIQFRESAEGSGMYEVAYEGDLNNSNETINGFIEGLGELISSTPEGSDEYNLLEGLINSSQTALDIISESYSTNNSEKSNDTNYSQYETPNNDAEYSLKPLNQNPFEGTPFQVGVVATPENLIQTSDVVEGENPIPVTANGQPGEKVPTEAIVENTNPVITPIVGALTPPPTTTVQTDTSQSEQKVESYKGKLSSIPNQVRSNVSVNVTGDSKIASLVSSISSLPAFKTVTVFYNQMGKIPTRYNGTANVNGSANARFTNGYLGHAYSSGNWGIKQSGTALTGELGQELVVRNGQFFTVGDTGPQLVHLRKNDIVFNHRQTKDILTKGYALGRGRALANGTAFSNADRLKDSNYGETHLQNTMKTIEKASEDFEKVTDQIAVLFNRIKAELSRLNTIYKDLYQTYGNQNKAIDEAINANQQYLKTQTRSYDKYMEQANASGLSDAYKYKVQTGEIQIEKITDQNLQNQIDEYTKWYEQAEKVKDTIVDTHLEIRKLQQLKLDNIIDDFKNIASYNSTLISLRKAEMDFNEFTGVQPTEDNYREIIAIQEGTSSSLRGKYNEVNAEYQKLLADGSIEKYTDDWYKWEEQLLKIKKEIADSDKALYEYKQDIRDIRWKGFNDGVDALEKINAEIDVFSGIIDSSSLFNEDGMLTEQGITQLGLYAQELGNARQLTAEYGNAIDALKKELDNGNITQEQYGKELEKYTKGQQSAVKATDSARDSILKLVKEGIKEETNAYKELIKTKKDDLKASREYENYSKKLNDKSKDINSIKAQMAAIQNDPNQTAEYRRLQAQLLDVTDEYNEIKADHEYDTLMDGYDAQLDAFQESQDAALEALDSNLEAQNQAIASALQIAQDNYSTVYGYLNTLADTYGTTLSDDLVNPWKTAANAVEQYKKSVLETQAATQINTDQIGIKTGDDHVSNTKPSSENKATEIIHSQKKEPTPPPAPSKNSSLWNGIGSWNGNKNGLNYNTSISDRCKWNGYDGSFAARTILYRNAGKSDVYNGTAKQNVWLINKLKESGFAKGGIAQLVKHVDEDGIALVRNGEALIAPEHVGNIQSLISNVPLLNNLMTHLKPLSLAAVSPSMQNITVRYDSLIGHIDNVTKDSLPGLEKILENAYKYTTQQLVRDGIKIGRK